MRTPTSRAENGVKKGLRDVGVTVVVGGRKSNMVGKYPGRHTSAGRHVSCTSEDNAVNFQLANVASFHNRTLLTAGKQVFYTSIELCFRHAASASVVCIGTDMSL